MALYMKKLLLINLLVLLLLAATPVVAYADVVVEPENAFYDRHRDDVIYLGRNFVVNGPDGYASVVKAPGSKVTSKQLENGEVVNLQYSCLYDGEFWGLSFWPTGWIRIDQLLVLYDYVSFEEVHIGEFYQYEGDFAVLKEAGTAISWPWPGAETLVWEYESVDMDNFHVVHAYIDPSGREWGFVTYLYGDRNIWICLDDPVNSDMPAFNPAPPPVPWVSATTHTNITDNSGFSGMLIVIIALIAVLVIGTIVLIKVFWKPV